MRVNVNYYKLSKRFFSIINLCLLALLIGLFAIYVIVLGVKDVDEANVLGIAVLSVFGAFIVFNTLMLFVEFFPRSRLLKVTKNYIEEKKYDNAIEYLQIVCQKKRTFSNAQVILFYLGYIELLKDNVEDAIYYLKQFELNKQNLFNTHCLASTISLLYIIYLCNKDEHSIKYINSIYQEKKGALIRATKSNIEITTIFNAIDCFNNDNDQLGISNLKKCRIVSIPLLQRFIKANS